MIAIDTYIEALMYGAELAVRADEYDKKKLEDVMKMISRMERIG